MSKGRIDMSCEKCEVSQESGLFEFAVRGMRAQAEVNKLCQPPLAHTNDHLTSFEAAEKMVKSGKFHYSVEQVREAIKRYCKVYGLEFTPKEVAEFISEEDKIDYFKLYIVIQKRKSVLKNEAFIKQTDRKRNDCAVWELRS